MKKIIILLTVAGLIFSCTKEKISLPQPPCTNCPPSLGNKPPVANAGPDQIIILPTNSVVLSGSGTDPDGTITAYKWTKFSGPAATITSPNQAQTLVTDLVEGEYQFQLTVFDNVGVTGNAMVNVKVYPEVSPDTLHSKWITIDSVNTYFHEFPGSSYFTGYHIFDTAMNFNSITHITLNYIRRSSAQGYSYKRDFLEFDVLDSSQPLSYKYSVGLGSTNSQLFIEGYSLDFPEPPQSVTLNAIAMVKGFQYRIIAVPISTYYNANLNWDNYLEVVAALGITP